MKLKAYVDDRSHALYWHIYIYTLVLYMRIPSVLVVVAQTHAMKCMIWHEFRLLLAVDLGCACTTLEFSFLNLSQDSVFGFFFI